MEGPVGAPEAKGEAQALHWHSREPQAPSPQVACGPGSGVKELSA